MADQAMYLAKRPGANAWVSVHAAEGATAEQLRRSEDSLARWLDEGVVTVEKR